MAHRLKNMEDFVNKVTVVKDSKHKEVSTKRAKRMSKRGWKEKTTPTPKYTISDLKGGDEGPTGPIAP